MNRTFGAFQDSIKEAFEKIPEDFKPNVKKVKIKTKNKIRELLIPDEPTKNTLKVVNDYIKLNFGYHPFFAETSVEDFSISGDRALMWNIVSSILDLVAQRKGLAVTFDIKDYFPSINTSHIKYLEQYENAHLNFTSMKEMAEIIKRYCFVSDTLPLGFPTSPTVAFLATRNLMKVFTFRPIFVKEKEDWSISPRIVVRYADNFLMFVPFSNPQPSDKDIKSFIHVVLKKIGMEPKFINIWNREKLEKEWLEFLNIRFLLQEDHILIKFPRKFTKLAAYFLTNINKTTHNSRAKGYKSYLTSIVNPLLTPAIIDFQMTDDNIPEYINEDRKFKIRFNEDRESRNLERIMNEAKLTNSLTSDLTYHFVKVLNSQNSILPIIKTLLVNGYDVIQTNSTFYSPYHIEYVPKKPVDTKYLLEFRLTGHSPRSGSNAFRIFAKKGDIGIKLTVK